MALISTRIPDELKKQLEWYAKKEMIGTAIAIRKIIDIGLKEVRLEYALDLYRKGKVSLGRAGEIAELSLWEMMDIVREKRIPMPYTVEDVEKDFEIAKKISKMIK